MTRTEVRAHVDAVEAQREEWIRRMRPAIVRAIRPIHAAAVGELSNNSAADPASAAAATTAAGQLSRDSLIRFFTDLYGTVGTAFATHAVAALAQQADVPDFSLQDPTYVTALRRAMHAYTAANVPRRVDRVLASLSVGVAKAAATPPTPTAPPAPGDSGSVAVADSPSATDQIDGVFQDAADILAEMEVVGAGNLGAFVGTQAFGSSVGVTLVKTWQSMHDEKVRPTHAEADGQTQNLTDPFSVGGADMMFPCDDSSGAPLDEIINCRCTSTVDIAQ